MKVKIDNTIYDSEIQPIIIILNQEEKCHISNMDSDATKYCSFPDTMDKDNIRQFMKTEENTFNKKWNPPCKSCNSYYPDCDCLDYQEYKSKYYKE